MNRSKTNLRPLPRGSTLLDLLQNVIAAQFAAESADKAL